MIFKGKYGPLLVAEIGGNHEGNFEYAKKLTSLAIKSNVDFIKFQIYSAESIVNKIESPNGYNHFKQFELTKNQHLELAKMVSDSGIGYMASVWDIDAFSWINDFIKIYKVGSGDLTAYQMIDRICQTKKPIILSTGLSTESEIIDTINYIKDNYSCDYNNNNLALLQCTTMYPIKISDANLNVINKLKEITGLTIGYSDHTEGINTLLYSYLIGAQILEFHFTDTRKNKEFRDHKVSLTLNNVNRLIRIIKEINLAKGNEEKIPLPIEVENNNIYSFRRGVYYSKKLNKGSIIKEEDLVCLRPNSGLDARYYKKIIGLKLKRNINALSKIDLNDFEINED